jgi:hypothetical protein
VFFWLFWSGTVTPVRRTKQSKLSHGSPCVDQQTVKMRFAEIATRALMSGVAMNVMDNDVRTSPNPSRMLVRQSSCRSNEEACGTGCMVEGSVCCAS